MILESFFWCWLLCGLFGYGKGGCWSVGLLDGGLSADIAGEQGDDPTDGVESFFLGSGAALRIPCLMLGLCRGAEEQGVLSSSRY